MLARMPPTVLCPAKFTNPRVFASAMNFLSRSSSPVTEYHVHEGAVFKGYRAVIKRAVVDKVIKRGRLFFIVLLNGGHTALLFYPLEHQSRHIDRVARRRVVHRTFLRMDFVIEIDRRVSRTAADEIFSDDDDRNPCRTYVFLCARENQAKVFYIIYFRQEVGGLIRSEDDVPGIRDVAVTAP